MKSSELLEDQFAFWRRQLDGAPALLEFPTDRPRPAVLSRARACRNLVLSPELNGKAGALSRSENVTSFVTLLAGFQALLSRYSGQEDIVTGVPATRGDYLAIRTDLSANPTFRELLARVSQVCKNAYAQNDAGGIDHLIDRLRLPRNSSYHPLFQVSFACEPADTRDARAQMVDMAWAAVPDGETLRLNVDYSTDLFDQDTMARVLDHYRNLLSGAIANPECRISELPLSDQKERSRILVDFNNTAAAISIECVHHLFEMRAREKPGAVALICGQQTVSYRELNAKANRIAHFLRKQGAGPELLIGIYCKRSVDMVAAVLGILKAGSAFVPLDPAYPKERLRHILEDAGPRLVLTQESLAGGLPPSGAKRICLDADWGQIACESEQDPEHRVNAENLAYVLFTSGSTGRPKGCQLEHRNLIHYLEWADGYYFRGPEEGNFPLFSSLSFDLTLTSLFLPLLRGRTVCVCPDDAEAGHILRGIFDGRWGTDCVKLTPSHVSLLEQLQVRASRIRVAIVGGEAFTPHQAQYLQSLNPEMRIFNEYGPTETTVGCIVKQILPEEKRILIGKPIKNTSIYILDQTSRPSPIGIPGEIYVAGSGVGRGYRNQDDLTAARFLKNPFRENERMYRTGDLGRWLSDGNIEFLGRVDDQVKIRGFRIELGEIESTLTNHPAVKECKVIVREDAPGEKRLVAYVVCGGASSAELRAHLQDQLPTYMVPAAFVILDALPLTPNGKVDRRALPAPRSQDFQTDQEYIGPRDAVERKLVDIWEELLGVRPIGVHNSFFDLGGQSIVAARMFIRIKRAFGKDLPIATLFRAPTIGQLAKEVGQDSGSSSCRSMVAIQPAGSRPPFFCVHGGSGNTLFLHRLARAMGPEQPFYGIESEGLDGKPFTRTTVEEMAAHYIAEMRNVQPSGPYFIGGYCFGGVVAFEMAQQLLKLGERAALVALFTTPMTFGRRRVRTSSAPAATGLRARIGRLIRSPRRVITTRLLIAGRRLLFKTQFKTCEAFIRAGYQVPQSLRWLFVGSMLRQAELKYRPIKYAGTLDLFAGARTLEADPSLGWEGFSERLERHIVGDSHFGNRYKIMEEPLVGLLAMKLTACMERAGAAGLTGGTPVLEGATPVAMGAAAV